MNLMKKMLAVPAAVLALWAVTAQATTDEAIAERLKPVGDVCIMGEECKGVELIVTNRETFLPVQTGVAMAIALRKVAFRQWEMARWQTLLCHKETFDAVEHGAGLQDVVKLWEPALQKFKNDRKEVLHYR